MAELSDLRQRIDEIDSQIFQLFAERTMVAEDVAAYKRESGMRIFDPVRERAKVADAAERVPEDLATYAQVMMELLMEASRARQLLMEASRARQHELLDDASDDATLRAIAAARQRTPELFPPSARVSCQGVEGAYSQIAAEKIFRRPTISYAPTFDGVFRAVEQGLARYGVIPFENSTAGSVRQVFDLMMEHSFHIGAHDPRQGRPQPARQPRLEPGGHPRHLQPRAGDQPVRRVPFRLARRARPRLREHRRRRGAGR